MFGLSPPHLLIILVIALIVVGPGKLPEVGAAIGKTVREFQKASGGIQETVTGVVAGALTPQVPPAQVPQVPQVVQPAQVVTQAPVEPYYPAQFYPPAQPAYPAPTQAAPMQNPPVAGAIEPVSVVPAQIVPVDYPQPTSTVQQPPSPPSVS